MLDLTYADPFRMTLSREATLRKENAGLRDALKFKALSPRELRNCYAMLNRIQNSIEGKPTGTGEPTLEKLYGYADTLRSIIRDFGG